MCTRIIESSVEFLFFPVTRKSYTSYRRRRHEEGSSRGEQKRDANCKIAAKTPRVREYNQHERDGSVGACSGNFIKGRLENTPFPVVYTGCSACVARDKKKKKKHNES